MNMKDFSARNRARCESPQGFNHKIEDWSGSDWAIAFVGEAGEAANIIKKLNRVRDGIRGNDTPEQVLRVNLAGELADAFTYLDLLAQRFGIDLADAVEAKFQYKSEQIGYVEVAQ